MRLPKTKQAQGRLLWALLEVLTQQSTGGRIETLQAASGASVWDDERVDKLQTNEDYRKAVDALQAVAKATDTPVLV